MCIIELLLHSISKYFFAKFISRDILKNEIYFLGEILKWLVHFGR